MKKLMASSQRAAPNTLLLIGAGGLGSVVAEIAQISGQWSKIAFLDDTPDHAKMREFPIIGRTGEAKDFVGEYTHALPTMGNNEFRLNMLRHLQNLGFHIPTIIHPRAFVSPSAILGEGCIILANAVVNTKVRLGDACLVHIGAMLDHDCVVGDGVLLPIGIVIRNAANIPPKAVLRPNTVIE